MSLLRHSLLAALATAAIAAAAPAYADMEKFKADLTGPGEVPPTSSKGAGSIEASYDTATKTLTWSGSYSGLTGPETAAHFHGPAPLGRREGKPLQGLRHFNRRAGEGVRRRYGLFQHPHRGEQGRRDSRADDDGEIGGRALALPPARGERFHER